MSCSKETVKADGLNLWHDSGLQGAEAQVDIVLVQDLNTDPYDTWASHFQATEAVQESQENQGLQEQSLFWPRDLLPSALSPCTISTYSYSHKFKSEVLKDELRTCGEQFLDILQQDIPGKNARPIVLIAHSFGGLVTQQALLIASQHDAFQHLRSSVRGFLFLGTPVRGDNISSLGKWAHHIASNNQELLHTLNAGSDDLLTLTRAFWNEYRQLPIFCFSEADVSDVSRSGIKTASEQSTTFDGPQRIYLDPDRADLNKFHSKEDESYQLFLSALQEVLRTPSPNGNCAEESPWVVPFSRDPSFVERSDIMTHVDRMLSNLRESPRVALWGLGGVGKSQIAIEYAYRRREQSPQTSIFWVHASSPARFRQSYQAIVAELQLANPNDPSTNHLDVLYQWLLSDSSGEWLLIIDNADDSHFVLADNENGEPKIEFSISQYIPQRPGGCVLATSRNRHAALSLARSPELILQVLPMTDIEAQSLLDTRISSSLEDNSVRQSLISMLDNIPLAISQAAAYITRVTDMSVAKYLTLFSTSESSQVDMLTDDGNDLRHDVEVPQSVIRTWEISFVQIESQNQLSIDLLSCMALLDRQNIPAYLLRQEYSEIDLDAAIELLSAYALMNIGTEGTTFSIHRLVQVATSAWLRGRGQLQHYQNMILVALDSHYPTGDYEHWTTCQMLEPHAIHALKTEYGSDDLELRLARVLNRRAYYLLSSQGKYLLSEQLLYACWTKQSRILGKEHPDSLHTLGGLAYTYFRQMRYKEAAEIQEYLVNTESRVFGEDNDLTLASMNNLALTYGDQGRLTEAAEITKRVVEMQRRKLGEEHPLTLASMGNLALAYARLGRSDEAARLSEQTLETRKRVLGEEHPDTVNNLLNLATTYSDLGRKEEAAKLEEQVIKTQKQVLGEEHPSTLNSMGHLVATYFSLERFREAAELAAQVYEMRKGLLGELHPQSIKSLNNLAMAYNFGGKKEEAVEAFGKLIPMMDATIGPNDPETLSCVRNFAHTLASMDRYDEACKLQERVVTVYRAALGSEHSWTKSAQGELDSFMKGRDAERENIPEL